MNPALEMEPAAPRILVVEDEVLIRMDIAEELRLASYTVIEAASADQAWAYLCAGGHADLVFSDIDTPGRLDGFALAREVRKEFPLLPIILTSGRASFQSQAEIDGFIPKPYDAGHAAQIIRRVVER